MPSTVDMVAIQYPGRQDRDTEPCVADLGALADQVAGAVTELADLPVALFGHGMGATLGFEVAVRLERDDVTPLGLFASGSRAPSEPRAVPLHQCDDDTLLAEITALAGVETQAGADAAIPRAALPVLRGDYRAAETYRPAPHTRVRCPILALIGDSDPTTTVDHARAWQRHTTARFDLHVFYGGHCYLNSCTATVVNTVSEHIAANLAGERGR